jgi:hypothetical protein
MPRRKTIDDDGPFRLVREDGGFCVVADDWYIRTLRADISADEAHRETEAMNLGYRLGVGHGWNEARAFMRHALGVDDLERSKKGAGVAHSGAELP